MNTDEARILIIFKPLQKVFLLCIHFLSKLITGGARLPRLFNSPRYIYSQVEVSTACMCARVRVFSQCFISSPLRFSNARVLLFDGEARKLLTTRLNDKSSTRKYYLKFYQRYFPRLLLTNFDTPDSMTHYCIHI